MDRKRVRRGESFGRMGLDRTISNSLKSPSRQKQKQLSVSFAEETPMIYLCSNFEPDMSLLEKDRRKKELWYSVRTHVGNMIILLARERGSSCVKLTPHSLTLSLLLILTAQRF